MAKKPTSEFPFSIEDRTGCITYPIVAIEDSFMAVRVVYKERWPEPRVKDHTFERQHIAVDRETSSRERTIYYRPPRSENPVATHIAALRRDALQYGATPEAIRLLGSLEPWTKKEETIMAEKLKAKATKASPAAAELKTAAKAAPVGGKKGASPRKGASNGDALAKARAAKNTGPDNRKIKVLIKKPEAREGSKRALMLADLISSKTVQEFRDKGSYSAGDVRYAIGAGIISVS